MFILKHAETINVIIGEPATLPLEVIDKAEWVRGHLFELNDWAWKKYGQLRKLPAGNYKIVRTKRWFRKPEWTISWTALPASQELQGL